MIFNQKLRFTFGHIVAFLSLIFVSYVSFMGITYWTDGNFLLSGIATAAILLLLLLLLLTAQHLKGASRRFRRSLRGERLSLLLLVLAMMGTFVPYAHFWTVLAQKQRIEQLFTDAIGSSRRLFSDYTAYADARIASHNQFLDEVRTWQEMSPKRFARCGFVAGRDSMQQINMERALQLQLLSSDFTRLNTSATRWLADASQGISTWNVFMLGNMREVQQAIGSWHATLENISRVRLTTERVAATAKPFDSNHHGLKERMAMLDLIRAIYTTYKFPRPVAFLTALFCFLCMFFPYYLQERNTKSTLSVFSKNRDEASLQGWKSTRGEGEPEGGFTL